MLVFKNVIYHFSKLEVGDLEFGLAYWIVVESVSGEIWFDLTSRISEICTVISYHFSFLGIKKHLNNYRLFWNHQNQPILKVNVYLCSTSQFLALCVWWKKGWSRLPSPLYTLLVAGCHTVMLMGSLYEKKR